LSACDTKQACGRPGRLPQHRWLMIKGCYRAYTPEPEGSAQVHDSLVVECLHSDKPCDPAVARALTPFCFPCGRSSARHASEVRPCLCAAARLRRRRRDQLAAHAGVRHLPHWGRRRAHVWLLPPAPGARRQRRLHGPRAGHAAAAVPPALLPAVVQGMVLPRRPGARCRTAAIRR